MVKQFIQKAWKDPVGSKVISVGVVGLIAVFWNLIVKGIDPSLALNISKILRLKIDLWIILAAALIAYLIFHFQKKSFRYDSETLAIDRILFNRIRTENNMEELVQEIKSHGFSGRPVRMERIDTLINFLEECEKTDFEFLHPEMEKMKACVVDRFKNLERTLHKYIFGTNNMDWVSIPSEWEYEQPDRFEEARNQIEISEKEFIDDYQLFISKGRKFLRL